MSIIYDALKKLDKDSPAFSEQGEKLPTRKRIGLKKGTLFFVILAVFISSFFLSYNYFDFRGTKFRLRAQSITQEERVPEVVSSPKPKEKDFIEAEPVLAATDQIVTVEKEAQGLVELSYSLEGIIFTENRPIAIINGQSFSEQDSLGDLSVVQISRSSVKLVDPETKEEKVLSLEF